MAISLFSLGLYNYIERVLIQEVDASIRSRAKTISQLVEIEPSEIDLEFEELHWDEFDHESSTASYISFNANSTLISRSVNANISQLESIYQQTTEEVFGTHHSVEKNRYRYIIYPFKPKLDDGMISAGGDWCIIITEDLGQVLHILRSLVVGCLVCGSFFIFFSILLHYWNTYRGLSPLRSIEQKVESVDSSNLDFRFSTEKLPSELKLIAAKLNDLLDRLGASFKRERSFSSSAAHELRTPLAELKAIIQVGMESKADHESIRYFSDANSVVQRMQSLLNALLTLVEGSREVRPILKGIDIGELLQEKVKEARQIHPSRSVQLDLPDTLNVLCDEGLLHGIVDNLLSNALEYADQVHPIRCHILIYNGAISLQFTNSCKSLDQSDLAVMADTFWRKEVSRSDSTHHGLGLTLVQAYASCMCLDFTIAWLQSGEIAFTISGFKASSSDLIP